MRRHERERGSHAVLKRHHSYTVTETPSCSTICSQKCRPLCAIEGAAEPAGRVTSSGDPAAVAGSPADVALDADVKMAAGADGLFTGLLGVIVLASSSADAVWARHHRLQLL